MDKPWRELQHLARTRSAEAAGAVAGGQFWPNALITACRAGPKRPCRMARSALSMTPRLRFDWQPTASAPLTSTLSGGHCMPLPRTLPFFRQLTEWHVRSQQVSRRNAMVACTALAERRHQRIEADEFLESLSRRASGRTTLVAVGDR
jgi:hypothetical protein